MSKDYQALLVFCEGSHDIALLNLVFKKIFQFDKKEWTFSEYPAPFDNLFAENVQSHAQKDLTLDMAHKFFLPDKVWGKDNHIILLFNAGGKNKVDKIKEFLANYLVLQENVTIFPTNENIIKQARYLFLYDADDDGIEKTLQDCQSRFKEVDNKIWLKNNWTQDVNNIMAATADDDKAVYIWANPDTQKGTLEDILFPLLKKYDKFIVEKIENLIDDIFEWDIDSTIEKTKISQISKRTKSIITVAGQKKKPGSSMSVIVEQSKIIDNKDFLNDKNIVAFADFIERFLN